MTMEWNPSCHDSLERLLDLAVAEDLGAAGDLATLLLSADARRATGIWRLVARRAGRSCGRSVIPQVLRRMAPAVESRWLGPDAEWQDAEAAQPVAEFRGPLEQMLAAERTLLNFVQRLSGIATLTRTYVAAVAGTGARIYDTRKTTPGHRVLEKYAVRCGGGYNHRFGLFDAVLLKDNHLAGLTPDRLAEAITAMLGRLGRLPATPGFVEVECDSLEQFAELLRLSGVDVILLDNFSLADLRRAVALRGVPRPDGRPELEASGGITVDNIRVVAETGVDRIAVGALTHSAPILDLGLDAV